MEILAEAFALCQPIKWQTIERCRFPTHNTANLIDVRFGPKADTHADARDVCFGPKADFKKGTSSLAAQLVEQGIYREIYSSGSPARRHPLTSRLKMLGVLRLGWFCFMTLTDA